MVKHYKLYILYVLLMCMMNLGLYYYVTVHKGVDVEVMHYGLFLLMIGLFIMLSLVLFVDSHPVVHYGFLVFIILEYVVILRYNPLDANMFVLGDETMYRTLARILADTGGLPRIIEMDITSYIYIVIINLIYYIFRTDIYMKLFNILFWCIGNIFAYKIIRHYFDKHIAFKATILMFISPLGLWFASSYYKDALLYMFSVLFLYCAIRGKKLLTVVFLTISVLIRPGYIFPMVYGLITIYLTRSHVRIKKGHSVIIGVFMVLLVVAVAGIDPTRFNQYLGWLSISEGRIGHISSSLWVNVLTLPLLTFVALSQPIIIWVTNPASVYRSLDVIGAFEGILTMVILPYALYYLAHYKQQSVKEKTFTKIGLVFYFSLALIGYVFTYRHMTYLRWIIYAFGCKGFYDATKSKEMSMRLVLMGSLSILWIVAFSYIRTFLYVRS